MATRKNDKGRAGLVPIPPGWDVPEAVVVADVVNGFDVEVTVVPDRGGRLVAHEVRVTRRAGGPAVTSEAIRAVPVAALTRRAVEAEPTAAAGTGQAFNPTVVTVSNDLSSEDVARLRENGPTTETLTWVARIYGTAWQRNEPPTTAVETTLGIPRSTAGRWVARARERGLLGPAEGPGKAGV